jgi:acyl-CoA thioester hydrolase
MQGMELFFVVIQIPVAWGDMDAMQHVNNTVYFRYFESARVAYFEKLGLLGFMNETGVGVILASTGCRFRRPLTYPDTVTVGTRVASIKQDCLVVKHALYSQRLQKIAATGEGLIVPFDYREHKRIALPEELRRRIVELEPGLDDA